MRYFLILLLINILIKGQSSYIIGDSQSFLLAKNSVQTKILPSLAKSGIGVAELNVMLEKSSVHNEAKNVFISIGVNDNYLDRGLNLLIRNLDRVFPNSYFYLIKGSYGWGNVQDINNQSSRYLEYYNTFRKLKIFVIEKDVGYGDPHHNKQAYAQIGDFIDYIVWKNYTREK
ncbi:hypothetical protein [Elizabethkingia anophelis]|uniref:hypothetical protein n=1 Tax=Elizabethkingia anophelis TaxID=1117645 RepID=UPI0002AC64F3|nr:hypothetical protein [Elizabethkingia anophelis]ELR81084.1 hypothetical protein D505_00950 [Elizabethkingia anophelis R26]MCS7369684.1 hypothetical protein [Elizabethkingia anophelis]MCS7375001.1 hypothetical protein [Elizabethkingia anophelis]MCS7387342.1 hypothetical protein [Elizabethkingia anophelis]HAY3597932.1 hypothetical protein [Elizabethkingia anophelis]